MRISKALFVTMTIMPIFLFRCTPSFADNFEKFKRNIDINQFFNELQGQVGYEGTELENKNKPLGELESRGVLKRENNNRGRKNMDFENYECVKGTCDVGHTFSTDAAANRAEEMELTGFSRNQEGYIENNKGFLDKALNLVKSADKEFDFLKSSTEVCTPSEEAITDTTIETCDQFYKLEEQTCFPRQLVEIDPKYHYQCSKKREVQEKTCHDSIVSIKCQNSAECDMGGIEPGSVASDMIFSSKDGILKIGTNHFNYWGGSNCDLYEKTTTFKLNNINLIKEFTLFYVRFDDYIEIFVNGHSIYAGPDGGSNLQKEKSFWGYMISNGQSKSWCERNTDWHRHVNIDLKPYLQEGHNEIRMKVFVQGLGHGYMEIRAKQKCCSKWDIEREEKCDYQ